jgi:hypothetical protein
MLGDVNENVPSASDKVHLREIVVTFHRRLPATIAGGGVPGSLAVW